MCSEYRDEEAIFRAAIKFESQAERDSYLKQACGDDAELLDRISILLKAHFESGDFLEGQAFGPTVTMHDSLPAEGPGGTIGHYKLLEKIGEGGMAVVYMAEQKEPISRKVALKIIKLGMDTKQVIARFEAERQALALMDHPNIAKVFDAGTTDTGRPYFVMELVRGVSLTEYCDDNELSTQERLDLFVQVCHAVQHAHQKSIIHRDIKPSNIMVTLHDDKAVPKVIDFGIAKATSQRLTEKTVFTRYAQIIGTPEYMSPEQAQFSGLDIDTRTDVYSLGVLLYELLTGTTPFDARRLRESAYLEIQRIIREEEPPKPSTRLSTMGEAITNIAEHRKTNPNLLAKLVRGDLDWIVMKSMEKDRTRRYSTAVELAADIGRHLNHEPVQAGAPTAAYKLRKFCRRHRVGVLAGLLVVVALIVGIAVATYGLWEARQERDRAVTAEGNALEQQQIAESERDKAREAKHLETLARTEAEHAQQAEKAQRELAEQQAEEYRRSLYVNRINLADKYYRESNIGRVWDLMVSCPEDLRGWEWYYLWRILDQAQKTMEGHQSVVASVALSPDGKRIVSGSWDRTLKVWDTNSGSELMTLSGHEEPVRSVAYSPDGKRIVSGSDDDTLKIWDAESGSALMTLRGHEHNIEAVTFSPDGSRIASGSRDRTVRLWDAGSGKSLMILRGHEHAVEAVVFSLDGRWIVTGSGDETLKLWDADSGSVLMTLRGHEGGVLAVALNPDSTRIVSGSGDKTLKVWDANSGSEVMTLLGHEKWVACLAFSPDGRKIISGSGDRTLRVWDADNGNEEVTLRGHEGCVHSVTVTRDGRRIITGSADSTLKVWDTESSHDVMTLKGHRQTVTSVAFSSDGDWIVSGSHDRTLRIWHVQSGTELKVLRGHADEVLSIACSPNSKWIASGCNDGTLKVWDAGTGSELWTLQGHRDGVCSIAFSPNGRHMVSGSRDKTLRLWDAESGSALMTLPAHEDEVLSVAWSPDDRHIASGGADGTLKIWDAHSGSEERILQKQGRNVYSLAFSPDGRRIVSSDWEVIRIWDTESGGEIRVLRAHRDPVRSLAFSPDARRIVSASEDRTIRMWEAESGEELMTLMGDKYVVRSIAFSPNGEQIVSGGRDETVKVWDAEVKRYKNRLTNADFEQGNLEGWEGFGCELQLAEDQVHTGSCGVLTSNRTEQWQGPMQSVQKNIQEGKSYLISGWVRLQNASQDEIKMTIYQVDVNGDQYYQIDSAIGYNHQWVQLSGIFTLNVSGRLSGLNLYFEGPKPGINFYLDDVQIIEISSKSPEAKDTDSDSFNMGVTTAIPGRSSVLRNEQDSFTEHVSSEDNLNTKRTLSQKSQGDR